MPRQELGEILLKADLVTEQQLKEALALQQTFGERLASVLVRQHILTEKFAVTYLGRQLGIPGVDLSRAEIDLALLEMVPLELCERKLVFPVKVEGRHLQIAMSDPADKSLVSEIEFKTGVRLAPMVSLESSIKNAILEARRAIRGGQKRIAPNVQRARDGNPGANTLLPGARPTVPGSEGAAAVPPEARPVPVAASPGRTVFETLAGAPLPVAAAATPVAAPPRAPAASPAPAAPAPAAPAPAAPAPAAPAPAAPAPPQPEPRTVLVVDSDEDAVRLLYPALQAHGYRMVLARSGREALARLKESRPDLVLMDGALPDTTGFEVCRQIRAVEAYRGVRVVLTSSVHRGWRFAADVKRALGADDYIDRPAEPAEIVRRLDAIVRKPAVAGPTTAESGARRQLKEGVGELKQGRFEEAVASFQGGLQVDPRSDMLHYYLAMTYEKMDRTFAAMEHYERAIQINPTFHDAITSLATLYQRQEFWRKAVEMWEMALLSTQDDSVRKRIKEHLLTLL